MSVGREELKRLAEGWLVPTPLLEPDVGEVRLAEGALSLLAEVEAAEAERDRLRTALQFCLRDLEMWRDSQLPEVPELTLKAIAWARRALGGES